MNVKKKSNDDYKRKGKHHVRLQVQVVGELLPRLTIINRIKRRGLSIENSIWQSNSIYVVVDHGVGIHVKAMKINHHILILLTRGVHEMKSNGKFDLKHSVHHAKYFGFEFLAHEVVVIDDLTIHQAKLHPMNHGD